MCKSKQSVTDGNKNMHCRRIIENSKLSTMYNTFSLRAGRLGFLVLFGQR